ncbi:MAG TPA: enoyl-CoA hydratase-related protein [Bryobacteraceae bacterium]|nr:enoyl-CoA hydratase-related protein [Bryobacteraceae bacterium]HOQ46880.1 enoyl-CoA hydratase-related protein [Bryobacteraceae bacterium]HPU73005.1 enoyl-CoA hydratase-related protein [Bryobacteraceae bacterium]
MSYSRIAFELSEDGIALVTINRPEKLNALNATVIAELDDAFARAASDDAVKGLILTGAGEKAFAAGADIEELAGKTPVQAREASVAGQRAFRRLELMAKPSVAAIHGFALGGGLELAMCCTVRVASEDARLGQPEVRLGMIPGYGGTQRLPRLVGRGRALEMLLTGEPVDAGEALRIGLVDHVVPRAELLGFSRALLQKMTQNAPIAAALIMDAVDVGLSSGLEEGLKFEASAFAVAASTEDRKEGTAAFLEKRRAVFQGK